ncbi:putative disease resistance RPP13-like protein 1 [Humulus lupulus]|uniref:putative disease resistance RPP13-like protein 1 n=1 Tax=Humulus lupulus TaxID=3486 RepID=UPI002B4106C5|nr:putative disease resistance RPP13-like protein 1 [Humulus lupulus]XP_062114877.1 putative disease resistance RPP13-like protein 1 [Humulus lupulus]
MGGMGKTTLAQLAYNDDKVKEHFELKVWICVSVPFDILRIMKAIIEGVTSKKYDYENLDVLRYRLNEALEGKKFLFVLDDVWNENDAMWAALKSCFESGSSGSKIIVTTRSQVVASVMATGKIYYLNELSDEDSWQLFAKYVFGENVDPNDYQVLQVIGREIVKKCRGFPLAIKFVGRLLHAERDPKKWEEILNSAIWEESYERGGYVLPALWLSYCHLPAHLNQCFVYCSIFPKDYEFDREKLILLWMAEGFLQVDEQSKKMEEVGEEYFQDLMLRSFFQHSSNGKSFFNMHDLVHDLAMRASDNCCFNLAPDNNFIGLSEKTRHLSYMKGDYIAHKFTGLSRVKSLRTFLALPLQQCYTRNVVPYDVLLTVGSCLRVFSLSESSIKMLPDSIGMLKHLRYLDLSFTVIEELPDTVCNLYNLQTLLLEGCTRLTTLPKRIGELINLRHLCPPPFLIERPQIGKMSSDICVDKKTKFSMKQLQRLKILPETLRISGLENVADVKDALEAELKNKKSVNKLILRWGINHAADYSKSQKEREVLGQLEPHANLKELEIHNYKGTTFPDWFGSHLLSNMVTVSLYKCKHCFILPPLGQLPSLKHLMISDFASVLRIGSEFYSISGTIPFRCLESLHLELMPELREWLFIEGEVEGGVFPLLKELELKDCPRLKVSLPNYLPSLRKLVIDECDQLLPLLPRAQQMDAAFPSLDTIRISECQGQEIFLEGGLPSSLKEIVICSCENLEALDSKAIQHLTSLEKLEILFCVNLVFLPKPPRSLLSLSINCCPLLTPRLQRETGEDWHIVADIPKLDIRSHPYLSEDQAEDDCSVHFLQNSPR